MLRRIVVVFLLCVGWLCCAPGARAQIAELVRKVKPAVVTIQSKKQNGESLGTGFVIQKGGVVLTAQHVIQDAEQIKVRFASGATATVQKVIMEDAQEDFALLQIEAGTYPTVALGDAAKLSQGDKVVVIGNPKGLSFTVTDGIVSALRDGKMEEATGTPTYVQVSAPISPGNSGGPVFNMDGQAIGVAVFKFKDGENLNFALSSNRVAECVRRLAASPSTPAPSTKVPPPQLPAAPPQTTNESWFLVASKRSTQAQSMRFVTGKDPFGEIDWIKAKVADGYAVTSIAEGYERWVVMMSKGAGYANTNFYTNSTFPQDKVLEGYKQGKFMTTALYSGDRWLVILSAYPKAQTERMDQVIRFAKEIPDDWIQTRYKQGYRLTIVNGDGEQWLVAMTKGAGLTDQRYQRFTDTPRQWIKDGWSRGFGITSVGNRSGSFFVVMSKGQDSTDQTYWAGATFPMEWVKERWNSGWDITCIR